jgi:two-component system response regulator FixJ
MAVALVESDGGEGGPGSEQVPVVAIVDDDASVRQSTGRLVRSFGYRVQIFASGREFLSSEVADRAACALLDVSMPEMDGLDVQKRLAERGARIPIVFLTARASEAEEQRARAAGAIEFLRKPVPEAILRQVIENVITRGGRNDNPGS